MEEKKVLKERVEIRARLSIVRRCVIYSRYRGEGRCKEEDVKNSKTKTHKIRKKNGTNSVLLEKLLESLFKSTLLSLMKFIVEKPVFMNTEHTFCCCSCLLFFFFKVQLLFRSLFSSLFFHIYSPSTLTYM